MKQIFTAVAAILLSASVFAQAPQKISYQAVIRNSANSLVTSHAVGMRVSIIQGSVTGPEVYKEIYNPNPQTNPNGLLTIEIGSGIPVTGTFATINWANGSYFIKTETDPTGGTNYTITGTSQLLSVPYALHAKSAETITGGITETDPVYKASQAVHITAADITKLNNLSGINTGDQNLSGLATISALTTGLATKVDKETGKGLSTNDYTTTEKNKLANIASDAEVNVNADWNATTGDAQILNKPTIPSVADGSETKLAAGNNVTITGNGTITSPYVISRASGTAPGQMIYWNGTAWVNVAPGNTGQVLTLIEGVPTWHGTGAGTNEVWNPKTGKIWMDSNLGAAQVATSSFDATSYGDLYQWGRRTDGHQLRTSGTTTTLSSNDTPGHGDFIMTPTKPYDWRSPQNDNLWQGVNGTNIPCPIGYRLPTEAELDAERLSWSSSNAAGAFASPLKLPVAGFRASINGLFINVGSYSAYWSSTVSGLFSVFLGFDSSNSGMGYSDRASGLSVRCLKE
jgi:hypothetical protein